MDELLKKWREQYDAMMEDTAELDDQIETLIKARNDIAEPYQERISELEREIKAEALMMGEGAKAHSVNVGYRKGYERISYDAGRVDSVLGVLRDVAPETAKSLEAARKSSFVSPSVFVKAE